MKSLSNPYLKRIGSLVGENDECHALRVFIGAHRTAGDSLDTLARKLGVSRIVEQSLPYEGGLFKLPDGELIVKLNASSSFARKRFTLAHEIGHLLLGTVPGLRSTCREDPVLERACDSIAAELLMPSEEAIAFISNLERPSPEKLRIIASKYDVSLHMAAIRVHADFHLWKCFIGCWDRHPQIKTAWFVGHHRWDRVEPDSYSLDLALASNSSVRTNDLWGRGMFTDPVWLNLLGIDNSRVLGLVDFVS